MFVDYGAELQKNLHPLQVISFDVSNSAYVIEASAGTGKTWTIERLFIKALLEATHPDNSNLALGIDNILVVTFTNDATNELKQRISEQIQHSINLLIYLKNQAISINVDDDIFTQYLYQRLHLNNYKNENDITILTRAIQNFDASSIYTIHGFCNKVLHDYPFECQVNTQFELSSDKAGLLEQLIRNFIRSNIITNEAFKNHLQIIFANLKQMFKQSTNFKLDLVTLICNAIPKDLFQLTANEYIVKYTTPVKMTLENLIKDDLNDEDLKIVKSEFISSLLGYINVNYPKVMVKLNTLSYDELIQIVANSVGVISLANKLFKSYPVIFIDEFQDTDLLQWQIFSTIYHLDKTKNANCRGNVIVVGDPKQAIYRFRGADVDAYIDAIAQIPNHLCLNANFRSHTNITNFINQLFLLSNQNSTVKDSFLGDGIDYTITRSQGVAKLFLPKITSIKEAFVKVGVINNDVSYRFYDEEVQLVIVNGKKAGQKKENMLKSMVFEILGLLNAEPTLKGKIAILVNKNKEATEIVEYLHNYGIKATQMKLGSIYATTMATNLYIFLNSINDLTNRRLFKKAITIPLFNLPLSNLTNANKEIDHLQQKFIQYQQIWNTRGLISMIYALVGDNKGLSNRDNANLWQLAELLNTSQITNQVELLLWFKQKIENAQSTTAVDIDGNSEELVRLDNDCEQIIVTSQHKAKGLEYEIVFCPYFKSASEIDKHNSYHIRPIFSTYRSPDKTSQSELVIDKVLAEKIVAKDNKEIHRLNYVALTRARSRIYIYLKQIHVTAKGKYNTKGRPDKLIELFGYVKDDPNDDTHKLFSYSKFFTDSPMLALKTPELFPGVVVYSRDNITKDDLNKLKLKIQPISNELHTICYVNSTFRISPSYSRQSYTAITRHEVGQLDIKDTNSEKSITYIELNYRYSILKDKNLKGAVFGVLFHTLCEKYPFSQVTLDKILAQYNINDNMGDYKEQLTLILDEVFNYPIIDNISISGFKLSQHELEFNLKVSQNIQLASQINKLLNNYFGIAHPFSIAVQTLGEVKLGFLIGFIDLIFMHEGKYWVLDYKTNILDDYTNATQGKCDGSIINSMAEHHYYLQYLLYLVAVKRYLEKRLSIDDATDLIGGAVYYYVRGVFVDGNNAKHGLFIDKDCRYLVRDLDNLFRDNGIK